MRNFIYFILAAILSFIFLYTILRGIDDGIQRQDLMLCNSAKVSGNVNWLHKCECYYLKGDVKCLQKEK